MAAQRGADLTLKLADATGAFVAVAGLRSQRILFEAEPVDATHAQSAGRWRELLAGAGPRRVTISGAGQARGSRSDVELRKAFFDGAARRWRVQGAHFGALEGLFEMTRLEWRGAFGGDVEFQIALESTGALAFTPPT